MQVGASIPLYYQLFDADVTKYVRAVVRDASGVEITGSPANLTHIGNGLYGNTALLFPNTPFVTAQYLVYDDAGYTTLSTTEGAGTETFFRDPAAGAGSNVGATSLIVGIIDAEESPALGKSIQDTIVVGSDRTLLLRLIQNANGEPFDLSAATLIECRFKQTNGSVLSVKSTDAGTPVVSTVPGAGKLTCAITGAQTALLKQARPAPFSVVVTTPSGVTVCNFPTQLAVEAQAV